MKILAVSGSLRAASSNSVLLRAVAASAPPDIAVSIFEGIGHLPHFNPDLDPPDDPAPHPAVAEWRRQLREADAVIISTPEYAHGVPGVLKNALDWIVGSGELVGKPVALFPTSATRGEFARASLVETLTVMSARVIPVGPTPANDPAVLDAALQAFAAAVVPQLR
jgi:NAD(P)H-dependent FMN reductase